MILKIIGVILILYGISSFIQSFRHRDSAQALWQEGIEQSPKSTSRFLRIMAGISVVLGLAIIFY